MKKLTPCLWFDNNAEQAVKFYMSIFKNSKILGITHYSKSVKSCRKTARLNYDHFI